MTYTMKDDELLTISGKVRAQIIEPLFSKAQDVPDLMMYAGKTLTESVVQALANVGD